MPNLRETLRTWAERLRKYKAPKNAEENERTIGEVIQKRSPYTKTVRLPDEITDGQEGYTIAVILDRHLYEGLKLPYIYCKHFFDTNGRGIAVMISYPDKDRDGKRSSKRR